MKCIAPFFLLCILPFVVGAQSTNKFGRTNSDTIPERFRLDINGVREHIFDRIPKSEKKEYTDREAYEFAAVSAEYTWNNFNTGRVYSDWPALELYVNEVMRKVLPPMLHQDTMIRAYIFKDASYNAFMSPMGFMHIHLGLIDEVDSEAELASMMAHEIAHYYLNHGIDYFVLSKKNIVKYTGIMFESSVHSKRRESAADSLALIWLNASEYGIDAYEKEFLAYSKLEKHQERLLNTRNAENWTHPLTEERLEMGRVFRANNKINTKGRDFVVSQKKFYVLKEAVKSEILRLQIEHGAYDLCIRTAFKYHLLNTRKTDYVYFLMEAIRQKCLFDKAAWKANFIMDKFRAIDPATRAVLKTPAKTTIFEESPAEILNMTMLEVEMMEGKFYWEEAPRFKTYSDALIYFAKVGRFLKEPECILTHALSIYYDTEKRNELLKEYLGYENIQHRDFAKHWLDGSIYASLPDSTLGVLLNFGVMVRQGRDMISVGKSISNEIEDNTALMNQVAGGLKNYKALNTAEYTKFRLNDILLLQQMSRIELFEIVYHVVLPDLFILKPEYWEFMKRHNINKIDIIKNYVYQIESNDNTLNGYKDMLRQNISDILNDPKRNRYAESWIMHFTIAEKGPAITNWNISEFKLPFRKSGKDALAEHFLDLIETVTRKSKIEK